MALIVHKYGGSSVADAERIRHVARRVLRAEQQGNQMVVVVSAMGKTTDRLVELADQVATRPEEREMDVLLSTGEVVSMSLLAMALHDMGCPAVSLTGAQAGIQTDDVFTKARIRAVDPARIHRELDAGNVVIVAGFQGMTPEMDITTLGRGGSDTTAVALAIALQADRCEIYTDVEGVYTADPRLVAEARKLKDINYDEMLEMATSGAKVMHSRAVELGALYDMPIVVASSFTEAPGTIIRGGLEMEIKDKVRGIAHDTNVAKITVVGVPDRPGIAGLIFDPLSKAHISVDCIVQNASVDKITDLTFTVARSDLGKAMAITELVCKEIGARDCVNDTRLAKVSIVGTGMVNTPGYAARMFAALAEENINIELITTSEIRITCIIDEARVGDAVRALHRSFALESNRD